MIDHLSENSGSFSSLFRLLERFSGLDDIVHVDSGFSVQGTPYHDRNVEEQCLDEKYYRHPLVVGYHVSVFGLVFLRDVAVERQVVGVLHPAVVVRVGLVRSREMRRHPARYRTANVLRSGHDESEEHEDAGGETVVQTVREIIVVSRG